MTELSIHGLAPVKVHGIRIPEVESDVSEGNRVIAELAPYFTPEILDCLGLIVYDFVIARAKDESRYLGMYSDNADYVKNEHGGWGPVVTMYRQERSHDFKKNLLHELGHYLFDCKESVARKDRWRSLYEKDLVKLFAEKLYKYIRGLKASNSAGGENHDENSRLWLDQFKKEVGSCKEGGELSRVYNELCETQDLISAGASFGSCGDWQRVVDQCNHALNPFFCGNAMCSGFVTPCAQGDLCEDYAESFAEFWLRSDKVKDCNAEKYTFMAEFFEKNFNKYYKRILSMKSDSGVGDGEDDLE